MSCEIPIGLRFSILHRSFRGQIDEMLREHDLTGAQLGVLSALLKREHLGVEAKQRDLEMASHVTHPTMTEMLKRLEKKGFIVTRRSETDRRSKCITLTEKGHDLLRKTSETGEDVLTALCEGLSEKQKQQLDEITEIMLNNIKCCTKGRE